MAKNSAKATYTLTELGEIALKKFPGHYKDLKNAASTVSYFANRLGVQDINGKKSFKQIAATDAEKILETMRQSYDDHPKTWTTPIEREIRKADREDVAITEGEAPTLPVIEIKPEAVTPEMKAELKEALAKMPVELKPDSIALTAAEKKRQAEEFAQKRKHFYTDVNYFMKLAQTPAERVAIWKALSNLYGIVATPTAGESIIPNGFEDEGPRRVIPTPVETEAQRDKWSI